MGAPAAIHFEVKKHAVRQTADGWVVSFVVHPNDMDSAFAVSPLGTRYMLAVAEIGDDELPVSPAGPQPQTQERATVAGKDRTSEPQSKPAGEPKDRQPWHELPPQKQAGILCGDKAFWKYVQEKTASGWIADEQSAAVWLREELGILSRRDIEGRPDLAAKLNEIRAEFMEWAGRVPVGAR